MNEIEQWQIDRINDDRMEYYRNTYNGSLRFLSGRTNLKEKHVIIYCEQGIGDILQMMRYIPSLLSCGCTLTMHCPPALHRLITSQWDVGVLDKTDEKLPDHDMHILSMDLSIIFGFRNESYIHLDEAEDGLEGMTGIGWTGNPDHIDNLIRSCPLRYFQQLPERLVCLHNTIPTWTGEGGEGTVNLLCMPQESLYDTAKIINGLARVITVDTSLLHLAGAMGKPTYGLLAKPCDPRWGEIAPTTSWYPSVTLVRQQKEGDWGSAFNQVTTGTGSSSG